MRIFAAHLSSTARVRAPRELCRSGADLARAGKNQALFWDRGELSPIRAGALRKENADRQPASRIISFTQPGPMACHSRLKMTVFQQPCPAAMP